mgnify:CR=1 FL=1
MTRPRIKLSFNWSMLSQRLNRLVTTVSGTDPPPGYPHELTEVAQPTRDYYTQLYASWLGTPPSPQPTSSTCMFANDQPMCSSP